MALEILFDNRDGKIYDISDMVSSVSWKTVRTGHPGVLDVSLVKHESLRIDPGAVIRVRDGSSKIFYGYVFAIEQGDDDEISITAYDQIRYLLSKDTFVFANATATEIIRKVAGDFGLTVGNLTGTGYRIPTLVEDNQTGLDVICKALDLTLIATGNIFVFYDSFGALTLNNAADMRVDVAIGDESLAYGYNYKRSIDYDTYNRIKLVQNNKETKRRDVYIMQDSANIAKWGRLQYFDVVDEKMNAAQIKELLNMLIQLKNRERRSLKIDALGDLRIRAGCYIPVILTDLGINQYFLVDECTHKWEGDEHTMSITLKVV
jgi:hypothetical protein